MSISEELNKNKLLYDKFKLKKLHVGGSALSQHLVDFYKKLNCDIYNGYGLTETNPFASISNDHTLVKQQ